MAELALLADDNVHFNYGAVTYPTSSLIHLL